VVYGYTPFQLVASGRDRQRVVEIGIAAAAKCDGAKRRAQNRLGHDGYTFVLFSIETYGWVGKPVIALLWRLGVEAAGAAGLGAVSKCAIVRSALRQVSVGFCRGNCVMSDCIGTVG
jgi:hypothetical protein